MDPSEPPKKAAPRALYTKEVEAALLRRIELIYSGSMLNPSGLHDSGGECGKVTPWLKICDDKQPLAKKCAKVWRSIFSGELSGYEHPATRKTRQELAVRRWVKEHCKVGTDDTDEKDSAAAASTSDAAPPAPTASVAPSGTASTAARAGPLPERGSAHVEVSPPPAVPQPQLPTQQLRAPNPRPWLPTLDTGMLQELVQADFKQLLPVATWEMLEEKYELVEFDEVEQLWNKAATTLRRGLASEATERDKESAQLLQYSMVSLVDSQLLAAALRTRASAKTGEDLESLQEIVVGTVGGILSLEEHDTILGIMPKTGCIGPQVCILQCVLQCILLYCIVL